MNELLSMGFGPAFLAQLSPEELTGLRVGRVCFEAHAHLRLLTPSGERAAILDPRLHDRHDRVVVGDWVVFRDDFDPLVLIRRLERSSALRRRDPGGGVQVVGANLDRVLLCTATGDRSVRRVERWLAIAADSDVEPVVVLTKVDHGVDDREMRADLARIAPDLPVVSVSAKDDLGREELLGWLEPGRTTALLGLSGVGKSTLVNWLVGEEVQDTGAVRDSDRRGRHTTTARSLMRLSNGAWLLDNPGVRQVGLVDEGSLAAVFPEVDALVTRCRFRDCAHEGEPGCAVAEALESGELDPVRFAAWRKLQREIAYERRREDPAEARAERERWKRRHREHKARDQQARRDGRR